MRTCILRIVGVVGAVCVLSCMLACGSVRQAAGKARRANDLRQVGIAYHDFDFSNRRGPADANEFATFIQKQNPGDAKTASLAAEVRSGTIVVYYGAKILEDFPAGAVNTVL